MRITIHSLCPRLRRWRAAGAKQHLCHRGRQGLGRGLPKGVRGQDPGNRTNCTKAEFLRQLRPAANEPRGTVGTPLNTYFGMNGKAGKAATTDPMPGNVGTASTAGPSRPNHAQHLERERPYNSSGFGAGGKNPTASREKGCGGKVQIRNTARSSQD